MKHYIRYLYFLVCILFFGLITVTLSGCTFNSSDTNEKTNYVFNDTKYQTEDYAVFYQVPISFEQDSDSNSFYDKTTDTSLSVISYMDFEEPTKDSKTLYEKLTPLLSFEDLKIIKEQKVNKEYHIVCHAEGSKNIYVLLTTRTIATPTGDIDSNIAITISSSTLDEKEIDRLFLYLQCYLKPSM